MKILEFNKNNRVTGIRGQIERYITHLEQNIKELDSAKEASGKYKKAIAETFYNFCNGVGLLN